jgi:hypothetical protein
LCGKRRRSRAIAAPEAEGEERMILIPLIVLALLLSRFIFVIEKTLETVQAINEKLQREGGK